MKINKLFDFILDIFFPKKCFGCQKEGEWLCDSCHVALEASKKQVCSVCKEVSSLGKTCVKCQKQIDLEALFRVFEFSDSQIIRKMIHAYKYKFVKDISVYLANILSQEVPREFFFEIDLITSVPLHKKRYKERGYNQAELMARHLALKVGLEYQELLVRKKYTEVQMTLLREERLKNIKNVFDFVASDSIEGQKILIIDDVATTLATLNECAEVLKKAGARQVVGLVVARDD